MNPEIREQWARALRSGEYQQGIGQLHQVVGGTHKYCCLGVLCDLAKQAGVVKEFRAHPDDCSCSMCNDADETSDYHFSYESEVSDRGYRKSLYLPQAVYEWAGLPERNPYVRSRTLAGRNDAGESFDSIAQLIEDSL